MRKSTAFSLVEVTVAIGVIAIGVLAILGLIPVGLKSGADAIDDTRTVLIARDVQSRAHATVTYAMFGSASDVNLPTEFYDRDGLFLGNAVTSNTLYRANATIHGNWGPGAPPNIDETVMRPVTVQIQWPINTSNGDPLGNASKSFTFYVRRP